MRVTSLVLAGGLFLAFSAFAAEQDPAKVSEVAADFGGVAASCGLDTTAYDSRVEKLLDHMAGASGKAGELISAYHKTKEDLVRREESERTIDCMDARRRFEQLPINQSGWTVESGWVSEGL